MAIPVPLTAAGLIAASLADKLILPSEEGGEVDHENNWHLWSWSEWHPNSSAILRVQHRGHDGAMTVRFNNPKNRTDYYFSGVPRELFRQWKRVSSPGAFYHRRIKGRYFAGGGLSG